MWRLCLFAIFILGACSTPTQTTQSTDTVEVIRGDAQLAVINLNILNRDATISPVQEESSEILFSASVEDVSTVSFISEIDTEAFISLTGNPTETSTANWAIETNPDVPTSYVIDVTDGTLNADLSQANVPRFDIVSTNSTVDIQLPSSAFQLAIASSSSQFNTTIPSDAEVQFSQLSSSGGLMTLDIGNSVGFSGAIAITSGGLTLRVPATTGVQIIVEGTANSEIYLPDIPRIPVEVTTYTTVNFNNSEAQIVLNASLSGAAVRIVQE